MRPAAALPLGIVALAVLAAATALPGCLTCSDQLDVHHCRDATGRCDPATKPTFDWDAQSVAALWPDITRLMDEVEPGLHGHADWTRDQADAFWTFYGVPLDQPAKEVLLRHAGELYHVRIQAC